MKKRGIALVPADPGQMSIEFVVVFPVALIIALSAINVALFFSECSEFDRSFRSLVCVYATSPGYEQGTEECQASILSALEEEFADENLHVSVNSSGVAGSLIEFEGTLEFQPTLFGKGSLTGVFGVSFPALSHRESIVVDKYEAGVFL